MIFNNLLYKNILQTSVLLIIALTAIFLTTRFGNSLTEVVAGNIATKDIFKIVGLKTLISVEDILPIALFIGVFAVITNLVNNDRTNLTETLFYDDVCFMSWAETKEKYLGEVGR